jgi:hypothetical protein
MATSAAVDNGFAVTLLNMISDHCAAAAVAPAASISMPADNAIRYWSNRSWSRNRQSGCDGSLCSRRSYRDGQCGRSCSSQAGNVRRRRGVRRYTRVGRRSAETASATAAVAITSEAKKPPETAAAPPAAHRTGLQADNRRPSATSTRADGAHAEIVPAPAETSSTPVAGTLPATDTTASATVTESAPAEAIPVVAAKRTSWLWIPIVVVVLIVGAAAPMLNRWRKRKLLWQSRAQNLSFSHRASSQPGTSDKPTGRKAA